MSATDAAGSLVGWLVRLAGFLFGAVVWGVLWATPAYNHYQQGDVVMAAVSGLVFVSPVLIYVGYRVGRRLRG